MNDEEKRILITGGGDPAEKRRIVREEMRRQTAKLPRVDSDGRPLDPPSPSDAA